MFSQCWYLCYWGYIDVYSAVCHTIWPYFLACFLLWVVSVFLLVSAKSSNILISKESALKLLLTRNIIYNMRYIFKYKLTFAFIDVNLLDLQKEAVFEGFYCNIYFHVFITNIWEQLFKRPNYTKKETLVKSLLSYDTLKGSNWSWSQLVFVHLLRGI